MEVYNEDFESIGTGSLGWTTVGANNTWDVSTDSPIEGTKSVKVENSVGAHHGWIWHESHGDIVGDGIGRIAFEAENYATDRHGVCFRCHDDAGTDKCYAMIHRNGDTLRLSKLSGTTETTVTTVSGLSSISTNTKYHVAARFEGSAIKGDYWADGGSADWDSPTLSTTDSTYGNTKKGGGFYSWCGTTNTHRYDELVFEDFNSVVAMLSPVSIIG